MKSSIAALVTTTEKNKKSLEQLIASLCRQTVLPERIVIIYDGILRPGKETFEESMLPITWIENRREQPLTLLQNHAIYFSKENYILFLNDDVVLEEKFVEDLFSVLKKDKSVGMACGKILRMDKTTIDTTGQFLGKNRKPLERGYGCRDRGQYNESGYIFGSCGAAVLYRRSMLDDCALAENEYFDADYNMFYEDLDLSWRANKLGWKAFYEPAAVAYHRRGATAKEKKPALRFFLPYHFAWLNMRLKSDVVKNRYMTIIKNDTFGGVLANIHHIVLYELKIFMYCLIFEPMVIVATFRNIPLIAGAFQKRRVIQRRIKKETQK